MDLRRGTRHARPRPKILSFSCSFCGQNGQNNTLAPTPLAWLSPVWEILDLPLENVSKVIESSVRPFVCHFVEGDSMHSRTVVWRVEFKLADLRSNYLRLIGINFNLKSFYPNWKNQNEINLNFLTVIGHWWVFGSIRRTCNNEATTRLSRRFLRVFNHLGFLKCFHWIQ